MEATEGSFAIYTFLFHGVVGGTHSSLLCFLPFFSPKQIVEGCIAYSVKEKPFGVRFYEVALSENVPLLNMKQDGGSAHNSLSPLIYISEHLLAH